MASSSFRAKSSNLKLNLFVLSLLSLSLSLLLLASTFRLKTHPRPIVVHRSIINSIHHDQQNKPSSPVPFDFIAKQFKANKKIKIGLVNLHEKNQEQQWERLGETTAIRFDQVSKERSWDDLFPEWIDEDEKWAAPSCMEIPMPIYKDYNEFDVVVSRVPCGNGVQTEGTRDLFRLQVNLAVANLVVNNGGGDDPVLVVFIGSCGPMWEIFRCDDLLLEEEGEFWIYKPDLRKLKQKVLMPVGTCQIALDFDKQGEIKINHYPSNLGNPIDHPREAYVTVLHSSEAYVCGAIALAQSIIQTNSRKDLVLLADESITMRSRLALRAAGWKIKQIKRIRSPQAERDAYNEWNYSKLRIWQLIEYDKIIFIDSDLIVLKNIDKVFAFPQLSAVGNDKVLFNSGIMLIEPSECVFKMLMKKRHTLISYNGGDQGFLNEAFTWWHRWPSRLNYLKIFDGANDTQHEVPKSLYAIHYLGLKPWMCYRDYDCNWDMLNHHPFASDSAHEKWWQVYDAMPKRLHASCSLSRSMDARIMKWRGRAQNARLPDGHWKIKVRDPRRRH